MGQAPTWRTWNFSFSQFISIIIVHLYTNTSIWITSISQAMFTHFRQYYLVFCFIMWSVWVLFKGIILFVQKQNILQHLVKFHFVKNRSPRLTKLLFLTVFEMLLFEKPSKLLRYWLLVRKSLIPLLADWPDKIPAFHHSIIVSIQTHLWSNFETTAWDIGFRDIATALTKINFVMSLSFNLCKISFGFFVRSVRSWASLMKSCNYGVLTSFLTCALHAVAMCL